MRDQSEEFFWEEMREQVNRNQHAPKIYIHISHFPFLSFHNVGRCNEHKIEYKHIFTVSEANKLDEQSRYREIK